MFQVLNGLSFLLFCSSAVCTGRRALHALLLAAALSLDCLIAVLLHVQRGVINRAPMEMALPIKALHIGAAVLGLVLLIVCLVVALRRWRQDLPIGPWGMLLLASGITVRAVAFGSSFLMKI